MVYDIYMDTVLIIILIAAAIGFALVALFLLLSALRLLAWLGNILPDANDIEITDKRKSDSR